jgi:hypothetical protein
MAQRLTAEDAGEKWGEGFANEARYLRLVVYA